MTDKQLIREGRYIEALGDNYSNTPIYVMFFKDGECTHHLEKEDGSDMFFKDTDDADYFLSQNKELTKNHSYMYGNLNSDWL